MNAQRPQTSSVPRRRRLQFGLGTLLVSIAAFSVWLGPKVNRANSQRRAVGEFEKLGLQVHYDYQQTPNGYFPSAEQNGPKWLRELAGDDYFQTVFWLSSTGNSDRVPDDHFAYVASFPDIRVLQLRNTDVTDTGLAHVARLRQLRTLTLSGKVSDGGLTHLKGLGKIESIDLSNNQITGVGLIELKSLTKLRELFLHHNPVGNDGLVPIGEIETLERLGLSHTQVTDDGLAHLASLGNLRYLGLSKTNLTDSGLLHLANLTSLQKLELNGTGVTDDGRAALQRMLPKCKITPSPPLSRTP